VARSESTVSDPDSVPDSAAVAVPGDARRIGRAARVALLVAVVLFGGPLATLLSGRAAAGTDWRSASHRSTGLAPDPATTPEAVVQVYAGRAFGWRGAFADHTWLAAKPAGGDRYTRFEVIGWYAGGGRSVVSVSDRRAPDAEWYGNPPRLVRELRGPAAEAVIARLPAAVDSYPHATTYRAWPGPNSNTFVAHLGRALPELRLALPPTAIGKDFVPLGRMLGATPSHTGIQWSVWGVIGVAAGIEEGLEVNLLGLVTGVAVAPPAVKLPGWGTLPGNG
jgi:hypothetical protein